MAAISMRKSGMRCSRNLRALSITQISLGLLLLIVEIVGIVVIMLAAEDLAEWHMLTILLFCGILIASGGIGIHVTKPVTNTLTDNFLRVQSRCMVAFLVLNVIAVILSVAAIVANALHLISSSQDYFQSEMNQNDPRRAAIHISGLVCYAIFFVICLMAVALICPDVCCSEPEKLALHLGDRDLLEESNFSTMDDKFIKEKRSRSNLKVMDHIRNNNLAVGIVPGSATDDVNASTVNSQSTMVSDQSSVSLTGFVQRTPSAPSLDSHSSTPSQSILRELDAIIKANDADEEHDDEKQL